MSNSFDQFMKQVDNIIAENLGGLTHQDIPDANHMDAFESGTTPEEWAQELIEDSFGDYPDDM
jgi:hypothetical protein